jgi:hypothetical protein
MLGHGFNSEIAQNKTMTASFDDHLKPQQISSSQSTSSDNSLQKKVIIIPSLCFSFTNFFCFLD